jgi:hypothetical protein
MSASGHKGRLKSASRQRAALVAALFGFLMFAFSIWLDGAPRSVLGWFLNSLLFAAVAAYIYAAMRHVSWFRTRASKLWFTAAFALIALDTLVELTVRPGHVGGVLVMIPLVFVLLVALFRPLLIQERRSMIFWRHS